MQSVLDIHADGWEKEILGYKYLVAVDFWHEGCPWCSKLNPILEEVAEEYKGRVRFARMNVFESDGNRNIAIKHGIMATPTLVFLCDGRPVQVVTGFQEKENLRKIIDNVIEKHRDCLEKATPLETS